MRREHLRSGGQGQQQQQQQHGGSGDAGRYGPPTAGANGGGGGGGGPTGSSMEMLPGLSLPAFSNGLSGINAFNSSFFS